MASGVDSYDVIVIGGGIEGSAIAYNLAKTGRNVLLLEQFPLPHSRGSSHGQSRITRYAYSQEFYVRMMLDAFPMWETLEKESGEEIYLKCGLLDFCRENSPRLEKVVSALSTHGLPHEVLSAQDLHTRFPQFNFRQGIGGVYDPNGGVLRADRALAAFQRVFKQLGGTIHDTEPVTDIQPGMVVTVKTSKAVYNAHNLVIATGAWSPRWTSELGLPLPIEPIKIRVMYWKVRKGQESSFTAEKLPCIIDHTGEEGPGAATTHVYGMFASEYPGLVKLCLHLGPVVDPDLRARPDTQKEEDAITEYIKQRMPNVETPPAIIETCMYTNTPDGHPYIGCHPKFRNIVIATAFCGSGFKIAPAVGKAVKELITGTKSTYNMEPFKLDRFHQKAHL